MRSMFRFTVFLFSVFYSVSVFSSQTEVTLAGFAFAGQHNEAKARFPYMSRIFELANQQKRPLSRIILERSGQIQNSEMTFLAGDLVSLKKSSQTLMAVLVLTGETVSTTCFKNACKIYINLRGDAMIFDAKSNTVVRNYPLNLNVFDVSQTGKPSDSQILALVDKSLKRIDENGIISQFFDRLSAARLPKDGVNNLNFQVANVEVLPDALPFLPEGLRQNPAALSDIFSSIFASRLGVPMLPARFGHAQGMMMLRLENGSDFELNIPKGDFLFDIKLTRFIKVKSAENEYGANYIFGAYVKLKLYSDLNEYINTDIKNGENAEILATQTTFDDVPAYQEALRGLFVKLSDAIKDPKGEQAEWLRTSVSAKNIQDQIKKTNDLIKQPQ